MKLTVLEQLRKTAEKAKNYTLDLFGTFVTTTTEAIEEIETAKADKQHKHSKSDITDFPTSMPASDVKAWAKEANKPSYTADEVGAIATSARGANGGVAELDGTGKVPSSRLPSTVSTDLLSQGTNTLIINCGNASF